MSYTVNKISFYLSHMHTDICYCCVSELSGFWSCWFDFICKASVERWVTSGEPQRRERDEMCETGRVRQEWSWWLRVFWWEVTCVWDRVGRWLWFCVAGSSFSEVSVCLAVCQESVGGRLVHSEIHSAAVGGRLPFTVWFKTSWQFSLTILIVPQLQSSIYFHLFYCIESHLNASSLPYRSNYTVPLYVSKARSCSDVCVCESRCTIVLTAPLFLSVSCTLWLQ